MSYTLTALVGPSESIAYAARRLRMKRYVDLSPDLKMVPFIDLPDCDGPL